MKTINTTSTVALLCLLSTTISGCSKIPSSCSSGLTHDEALDRVLMVKEFQKDIAVTFLSMRYQADFVSLIGTFVSSLFQGQTSFLPAGAGYTSDGTYRMASTDDGASHLDLKVTFGTDYNAGVAGTAIPADLFSMSSYLTGMTVTPNISNRTLDISYASTGPLVELLGYGTTPPNPLQLALSASLLTTPYAVLDNLVTEFRKLKVSAVMTMSSAQSKSHFNYAVTLPTSSLSELVNSFVVSPTPVVITGTRADTNQTLEVTNWNANFALPSYSFPTFTSPAQILEVFNATRTIRLDGSITAKVTGGGFDYQMVFTYDKLNIESSLAPVFQILPSTDSFWTKYPVLENSVSIECL